MSSSLNDDVMLLTKQLIHLILGFHHSQEIVQNVEKYAVSHLERADSLFYTSQKELDRTIDSLCNKFVFHGFGAQAKDLKRIYNKLTPESLSKQDRINRLNIIKFLLGVSESPTNNFYKYPQKFEKGDEEDAIDWPKYLSEGIPRWSPPIDDGDSSEWSDNLSDSLFLGDDKSAAACPSKYEFTIVSKSVNNKQDPFLKYHNSKANLLGSVQSGWFSIKRVCSKPLSDDRDANVALLWDDFIRSTTKGLIPIQNSNIFSEYKIMREVIWQFYEPHSSSCFQFMGNRLIPKFNVTISSVRMKAFESFLYEFVPYIEWLQTLRGFHESLITKCDQTVVVVPDTYRSYDFALQTVVTPIFCALSTIESKIKAQEMTATLLTLAHDIRPLFRTVKILRDIHCHVILDFRDHTPLQCATTLLLRLHKGLVYASSKQEQDLYLTLYLHSLYKYFTIVNSWLSRDVLEDYTGEFVIADKAKRGEQDWQMEFSVKELDDDTKSDSFISRICIQVLQIGKNIHLLRLLGKLHLVPEFTGMYKETLYEAYTERILQNIATYFNSKEESDEMCLEYEPEALPTSPTFIFPAACPDECKYLTEMDKLENLVDTSDGFLVKAFESFFVKKVDTKEVANQETLFERVSKLTKSVFPVHQMTDHIFGELLKERFSISGLMVKNVLINEYGLEKQFSFLKIIFLFRNDMIFPLYRRIFQQLDCNGVWGNHMWLTSYLQDVIMDAYPKFYKECSIDVKETWKLCTDPLKACGMVSVQYRIHWPANIIIRDEHMELYKDLFQFILKIKWALYTLNHLYFTDLEPKGKSARNQHKSLRSLIAKLKILRFGLINIFSSIQHYILGHVFNKYSYKFDKAFEAAYDLESLLLAHADFIQSLHKVCFDFQEFNSTSHGFYLLLYLVRKLRIMWRNLREVNDVDLDKYEKMYWLCHENIDPIINPTGYYAYISED